MARSLFWIFPDTRTNPELTRIRPRNGSTDFRFRGRRLFEHGVSCDIYSGVERRLTGPGNNRGIRGVTALRHWSPEEEEEHSDGPRLMECREMQREIDGSRLTIPTN
jgi:hypothetical protein